MHATREGEDLHVGVSTRGALTLYRAAQSLALVSGRDYVVPDDIKTLAVPVLAHRVVGKSFLQAGEFGAAEAIIRDLVDRVPRPVVTSPSPGATVDRRRAGAERDADGGSRRPARGRWVGRPVSATCSGRPSGSSRGRGLHPRLDRLLLVWPAVPADQPDPAGGRPGGRAGGGLVLAQRGDAAEAPVAARAAAYVFSGDPLHVDYTLENARRGTAALALFIEDELVPVDRTRLGLRIGLRPGLLRRVPGARRWRASAGRGPPRSAGKYRFRPSNW